MIIICSIVCCLQQQAIRYPGFDPLSNINDIALIQLNRSLTFDSHVQPACLWPSTAEFQNETKMIVAGWGIRGADGMFSYLTYATVW